MMKTPDVSIIVTFHREQLLAHTTLLSITQARAFAQHNGISTELLAVLDNADEDTRRAVIRHPHIRAGTDHIFEVAFGDPSLSRNYAVSKAKARFVSVLDGDDLISENFIYSGYQLLRGNRDKIILHPEINLGFDHGLHHWRHEDQTTMPHTVGELIAGNFWNTAAFSRVEAFRSHPYRSCQSNAGFGYEDWHWNCETINAGYVHKPALETIRFERVKSHGSRNAEQVSAKAVLPPSDFFFNKNFFGVGSATESLVIGNDKSVAELWKKIIRVFPTYRYNSALLWEEAFRYTFLYPSIQIAKHFGWSIAARIECLSNRIKFRTRGCRYNRLPNWAIAHLKEAALLEPKLDLSMQEIKSILDIGMRESHKQTSVWSYILDRFGGKTFTHIFLLPWLVQGGADMGALRHIRAVAQDPNSRALVFLTTGRESPWLDRLPANVELMPFGSLCSQLNDNEQENILVRFLLQWSPSVIHNINSELAWKIFCANGAALKHRSRLYASVFCTDQRPDGRSFSYSTHYLPKCYKHLTLVFCDSQSYPQTLERSFGFPSTLFSTLYFPTEIPRLSQPSPARVSKILWASRLDRQKRPDLLVRIAEKCPQYKFDVWGTAVLDSPDEPLAQLGKLGNVAMRGAFRGFSSLPLGEYGLFLYTSEWDGLPNILSEAAAHGLPIVASNVGAVSELITSETGFLITPFDDVDSYIKAIDAILAYPENALRLRGAAHALVQKRHSLDSFKQRLTELCYLGVPLEYSPLTQHRP